MQVRRGIEERQYVPNWVPSKGNVEALLNMEVSSAHSVNIYTIIRNIKTKNLMYSCAQPLFKILI